jgi:hypothetical protein
MLLLALTRENVSLTESMSLCKRARHCLDGRAGIIRRTQDVDFGGTGRRRLVHPAVLAALAPGLPGNASRRVTSWRVRSWVAWVLHLADPSLGEKPVAQPTPFALAPNTSDASLLVGYRCGSDRRPVKTLSDLDADKVNLTPVRSTVSALVGTSRPQGVIGPPLQARARHGF